jgi:hypothetical protein
MCPKRLVAFVDAASRFFSLRSCFIDAKVKDVSEALNLSEKSGCEEILRFKL